MKNIRDSDDTIKDGDQHRPAFSWPGRRRADEAAEAADRAALQGLERLRGRTRSEQPDAHTRGLGDDHELRALVFEATQQLRDAIKIEANEIGRLIRSEREMLKQTIQSLQELTSELKAAAPAETKSVSRAEHRPPPKQISVDLNEASHADLCAIGMSETQASRVIRHRDFSGDFKSVSELDHVPGFSPAARAELHRCLSVRRADEEAIEGD